MRQRRIIVLIDDSATYRAHVGAALEEAGYVVHPAITGEAGLTLVATVRPDAVIVDGVLPGIDGATVVRRLKSDTALRRIPCLLLTAAEGASDELRSLEAGADAYLRKSDDLGLLLVRIGALLRGSSRGSGETTPSLLGPKRLLAVDDSQTYLQALREELTDEGYEVLTASSGEAALRLLAAERVDCILLDLVMPGLSGQETCRRIKESTEWRDIPLMMLTAREDREAMIEGINAGADDYIAKSADFDVLKARLRAQLRRKHFEDESRRVREQLVRREAEARFHKLFYSNIVGVFFAHLDGRITDANDAFLGLMGYTQSDLERGLLRRDTLSTAEFFGRNAPAREQLKTLGSVPPFEQDAIRKDGTRLPIMLGLVLLDGSETVLGFVLDRTEQKTAEEKIRSYTQQLERANRELELAKDLAERSSRFKSSFLASMSHELRTPLNAIIGFGELLFDGQVPPDAPEHHEFLGDILTSARHLLQLINDVLDLSKVEAGKLEFRPETFDLATLVGEVAAILRPAASERRIRLEIDLDRSIGRLFLDPARFKQVLYNYLSNALKFTPEGGRVSIRAVDVSVDRFRIEVRDTGIGIAQEDLGRLFAEFQQLGAGAAVRQPSTGLGLALTKRLVEAQGGEVGVESQLGRGTMFFATLPKRAASTEQGAEKRGH
ncbi:MAG TPA: response regulator [Polyangiaceae bacterium]|nr:response regulator [Polyangiaceae bacterium]